MIAIRRRKRNINPSARVAHPKPAVVNSDESIDGKIIPPIDPPQLAIPEASPRRWLKKWPIDAIAGLDIIELPRPPSTEKARTI